MLQNAVQMSLIIRKVQLEDKIEREKVRMWDVTSGRSLIITGDCAHVPWVLEWLFLCPDLAQ